MKKLLLLPLCMLVVMCRPKPQTEANLSETIWYETKNAYDSTCLDVLYWVSTDVLANIDEDGNPVWQTTLSKDDMDAMEQEMAWVEKNMFGNGYNLYAPYYHQFTFESIYLLSDDSLKAVYQNVAEEACRIFDEFMAQRAPDRPFVLAGFSQGAMLTLDILRHMTDEQYQQMVACYTMGYRLSVEDIKHPHIRPATDENGRGVVISYNTTMTTDAIWPFVTEGACTCINPVNWKTDATPAHFGFNGTDIWMHVDTTYHVIDINCDHPEYYERWMDAAAVFARAGVDHDNLHHWDLLFYAPYIHANGLKRAKMQDFSLKECKKE